MGFLNFCVGWEADALPTELFPQTPKLIGIW